MIGGCDTSPDYKEGMEMGRAAAPATPWLPCAKGAGMRSMTEGLSARLASHKSPVVSTLYAAFPICFIESRLSYPLRHFVTPPLTSPFR